jgi:lipoprotein NlpI
VNLSSYSPSLLLVFIIALSGQSCSLSSSSQQADAINTLMISEPLPINYKSEIAIARLTDVIQRAEITDVQRAQLFYDRGVIYDGVGLRALARLDFNRALHLKPDLVQAYNFIGIHFTLMQDFNHAYDALDAVIELQPQHEYAYLNRGLALYYGGRPKLAIDDLLHFYRIKPSDAYRILWLYFSELSVDKTKAIENIKIRRALVRNDVWGQNIIALYLNELSPTDLLNNLAKLAENKIELSQMLCEAYFYLAKYYQMNDNNALAAKFFQLSLSTNVYEFVEHRYAKLELDLLTMPLIADNIEAQE